MALDLDDDGGLALDLVCIRTQRLKRIVTQGVTVLIEVNDLETRIGIEDPLRLNIRQSLACRQFAA